MAAPTYDIAIIGAGAVGCALARELARDRQVIVLERHAGPGCETSQWNSGVIHSGIHLQPSFLKARLARAGSRLVVDFCRQRGVPCRQVGMHIVVAARDVLGLWSETRNLREMLRRAAAQSIPVELVSGRTLRRREPAIHCLFGLRIPEVHIIDPSAYVQALYQDALDRGATFRFGTEVRDIVTVAGERRWAILGQPEESISARLVINAAGLNAADLATTSGFPAQQHYYRGEYYEVTNPNLRVSSLVYPVFRPGDPGLGIHLTPTVDGRLLVGPNARRVERNVDYDVDPTPPEAFHAAVRRFLPDLRVGDLTRIHPGIRPKLSAERQENDFRVAFEGSNGAFPPIVHLLGIESPGLTASLALARYVATGLRERGLISPQP